MSRSFLQFNDMALQVGLVQQEPALAATLKSTTQQFLSLARLAQCPSEAEADEQMDDTRMPSESSEGAAMHASGVQFETVLRQRHSSSSGSLSSALSPAESNRNTRGTHDSLESRHSPSYTASESQPLHTLGHAAAISEPQPLRFEGAANAQLWPAIIPATSPHYIPSAQDFLRSHESSTAFEGTFSRRLRRQCLESAYYMLANVNAPEHMRNRIFKYSFIYMDKEQLMSHLYQLMLAMNTEPNGPIESLRRRSQRNICGPDGRGGLDLRPLLGPAPVYQPTGHAIPIDQQHVRPESSTQEILMEMAAMEGEWYGPEDIEQYLREKGVKVDSRTSFTEVSVEDLTEDHLTLPPTPESLESCSGSVSAAISRQSPSVNPQVLPMAPEAVGTYNSMPPAQAFQPDAPHWEASYQSSGPPAYYLPKSVAPMQMPNDPYGFATAGTIGANGPYQTNASFQNRMPQKKNRVVTLDMSVLMKGTSCKDVLLHGQDADTLCTEIMGKGICLGVSPGFKKSDVDRAIKVAMQSY